VMSDAGSALMGIGSARGDDRAVAAAEMAVSSPLLEASIDGAHGVLLSIAGGSDLGLFEINEAAALVSQAAHAEANIIFGAVIDDALGDEVRVTVIAAGFDGGTPKRREAGQAGLRPRQAQTSAPTSAPAEQPAVAGLGRAPAGAHPAEPRRTEAPVPSPVGASALTGAGSGHDESAGLRASGSHPARPPRPVSFDDDELDVPEFLK
jgi:cell division protein FtsZ